MATTKERAQRILLVLSYIVERQDDGETVLVSDVVERFGIPAQELTSDLDFVMSYVGVAPFTPDCLVEVYVEDDEIWMRLGSFFRQPLHLSEEQALALLTAGQGALSLGEGGLVLEQAVTKLSNALGAAGLLDVDLADTDPEMLRRLGDAARAYTSVQLQYRSYGRDETTERTVDPYELSSDGGHWYLTAWCHERSDFRMFRVDRIVSFSETGEIFERVVDTDLPVPGSSLSSDGQLLRVEGPAALRWVAETYPVESLEDLDDRVRITIRCESTPFLERLLLRLGSDVEAIDTATGTSVLDARAAAARRILSRYAA